MYQTDEQGNYIPNGCYTTEVRHHHEGDEENGGNCYRPVYHEHGEYGGKCWEPVYHEHKGSSQVFGGCYTVPVKNADNTIDHFDTGCGMTEQSIEKYERTCGKYPWDIDKYELDCQYEENELIRHDVGCGMNAGDIESYARNCNQEITYTQTCNKKETIYNNDGSIKVAGDVDYYITNCTAKADGTYKFQGQVLTEGEGEYKFTKLNAMKKYYVVFVYNGMLYTNVEPFATPDYDNVSKSTEVAFASDNRTRFNNIFAEICSYPDNYDSPSRGNKNEVFLQEDIVDTFKTIASNFGNHGNSNKEVFAYDCRISAASIKDYPVPNKFSIYPPESDPVITATKYPYLYEGIDNPKHINLGIKTRPTFDLALYKDVYKAQVQINGKEETYIYDDRKGTSGGGFTIGVNENDYLHEIRQTYVRNTSYNQGTLSYMPTDSYDLNVRSEEAANGNPANYDTHGKVDNTYELNYDYNLQGEDRLKIFVTYKIKIRNQSAVEGAITEIVDYYDTNYKFVEAYVGNEKGEKNSNGRVIASTTSKYTPNSMFLNKDKYHTIYLIPEYETRLGDVNKEQYIYVKLQLVGPENDAGNLLTRKLITAQSTLETLNIAEINGYKTYDGTGTPGLIDKDSNPGNFDMRSITSFTDSEFKNNRDKYQIEDDTNRAPAYIYKLYDSKTQEGKVFEDSTGKDEKVYSGEVRQGDGLKDNEQGIAGVWVQLIEIKNGKMIVRADTITNSDGWYGFTGFIPGNYTIRFIYGHNVETAMKADTYFINQQLKSKYKGANAKSYNGQDFASTIYTYGIPGESTYTFDLADQKIPINQNEPTNQNVPIHQTGAYWYKATENDTKSDAYDNKARIEEVIAYSRTDDGVSIVNHKGEVFNAYEDEVYYGTNYTNYRPSLNDEQHAELANELMQKTYRYAYTPEMSIEVEIATPTKPKYENQGVYPHPITNVDFGIVERPKSEVTIDQDIDGVKIVLANGTTLIDTKKGVSSNVQMPKNGKLTVYDKEETYNIQLDDELISGATLAITYNITLTNNSEINSSDRASNAQTQYADGTAYVKNIVNYVPNNLTFEINDNKNEAGDPKWEVVSVVSIQNENNNTFINNRQIANGNLKDIDLSTQSTIIKATNANVLIGTELKPARYDNAASNNAHLDDETIQNSNEAQITEQLTLRKIIASESAAEDLTFNNLTEIVELDNNVGRYDHGAIPGNQSVYEDAREHDTSGGKDGEIIITPPTGSKQIYYVITAISAVILLAGVYLIKKKVLD